MTQKYLITFPDLNLNTDIIPDINDILPTFTNPFSIPEWGWGDLGFEFPPTWQLPQLPDLPSFPSDFSLHMPDLDLPSWSAVQAAGAIVLGQILSVIDIIISKLEAFGALFPLTGILPIHFPVWPGFSGSPGFNLDSLMEPNPLALLANIKLPDFDFDWIPNLPELWLSMTIPSMAAFHALQVSVMGYMEDLLTTITDVFKKVIKYFKDILNITIPALPTIPAMPTWDDIKAMLPAIPTLADFQALFSGSPSTFSFPGWEGFHFSLPDPLIPDLSLPDFDLTFNIAQMFLKMIGTSLQAIVDWINNIPLIKNIIGAFKTITDLIQGAMSSLSEVCHESVNTGVTCFDP